MIRSLATAHFSDRLDRGGREHLERLMATWSLLADLSFSDLVLYIPVDRPADDGEGGGSARDGGPDPGEPGADGQGTGRVDRELRLATIGQVRATTSPTLLEQDLVGQVLRGSETPLVHAALTEGVITRGMVRGLLDDDQAEVQCIPVRYGGEVLGVLSRTFSPAIGRRRGQVERTYLHLFDRLAAMVSDGLFPFVSDDAAIEEAPRVGDGVMIVDEDERITFASPNAVSALHRMGVMSTITGATLDALGIETRVVEQAFATRLPAIEELDQDHEAVVLLRSIPLVAFGELTGAAVLMRDVTDLRRRDRLLLSKDAAIREVHHRVKNNLQTIMSLLRIQARRLGTGQAREALVEAERRVRSIALVHELLSRESGDQVPFDEIVHSLVRMAKESSVSGRPLALRVAGDVGKVSTDIATPLAVVLAELLQNAVEHAFVNPVASPTVGPLETDPLRWDVEGPDDEVFLSQQSRIDLVFRHDPSLLRVEVRDNGRGMPAGFEIDRSESLGLSIVRDLVTTQLDGSISFASEGGTVVRLEIPLRVRPGRRP